MPTPQQVLTDPNFHALPLGEQLKVMRTIDPNFAALPPKEQGTVIYQAKQKAAYPKGIPGENGPSDRGFIGQLGSDLVDMGVTGAKLALAPSVFAPEIGQNILQSHIDTGRKALDAYKHGNTVEALGYGGATMLPMLGPLAAQTGEEVGSGQTGQGLAHGLELLGPPAVKAVSEIPAVSSAASNAAKVAKVKTKGAYEGAKTSADLTKSGIGAVMGEWLGQQLGHPFIGAEIGAGLPMVRGAIKGALDAKVPPLATPPPLPGPRSIPPIWEGQGATGAPLTPLDSTIGPMPAPKLPSGRAPGAAPVEAPAATPKIPSVEGTPNMLNIDLSHLGELPKDYVQKIQSHNSPLNAANKDAAMVGYLKSRGVTTKAQFDGASDFQHQEWNRESDALRGVKSRPMNADAKARLRLLLK